MAERIIQIDSVDSYNKLYGWETLHPLVTVVNHANPMASDLNHSRLNYGLYALCLKHFSRLFKSRTGMTPNAYRLTA